MEEVRHIQQLRLLKVVGDSRRLEILRRLMKAPETLSSLGKELGESAARVRHHLKQLEQVGLVELCSTRIVGGFVEKYYSATAQTFLYTGVIMPKLTSPEDQTLLVMGSHDLALEALARHFNRASHGNYAVYTVPVGSLEGLVALRQGMAHLAGCHLYDKDSGEFNLPYIRHFFPDRPVQIVTLVNRLQGLLLSPGNPLQVRGIEDLAREDLVLINRNRGSGTRLWLDRQLESLGIATTQVHGYDHVVYTHTQVAAAIQQGKADAGLGLQAAARQLNLGFIPLFQERFDLVFPLEYTQNPHLNRMLDHLQSKQFKDEIQSLEGYETVHTGERISP